jgi:hypothetical protein
VDTPQKKPERRKFKREELPVCAVCGIMLNQTEQVVCVKCERRLCRKLALAMAI